MSEPESSSPSLPFGGDGQDAPAPRRPLPGFEGGTICAFCGGLMVRTGACETCTSCGTSNGGCG